ncbi:MAG: hypothetical protein Q8R91_00320 [Candidatus Omnitrophota bacterium]|nr:hypothetical protein [Candidatus Omnitrophota bacterium]
MTTSVLDLDLDFGQEPQTIAVQDEPALEIALPQVFVQPTLTALQRGRRPHVEALAVQIAQRVQLNPTQGLGPDYQELVNEFQPLFAWAIACWDYLLSTEGCRFVPRSPLQKSGARGDYRVVTDKDFSRLAHGAFRRCVLDFAETTPSGADTSPHPTSLSRRLRERFWPLLLQAYRELEQPPDPRQRILTPYSYLRCVPYQFLNPFHQDLVDAAVQRLPVRERQALDAYFLQFSTEPAAAEALGCPVEELRSALRQGLLTLLLEHRLVYCLLRQIERY